MSKAFSRKQEIAIDRHEGRVLRVDDEEAHHAHGHLHHFVGMRVVHEGTGLHEVELVDEGLAGLDMRLRQAADAIHAGRQDHAVPMDGCVLRQLVGDEDAHALAFHRLDGRPGRLPVIAPHAAPSCLRLVRAPPVRPQGGIP